MVKRYVNDQMNQATVAYHNDFNYYQKPKFNTVELNIFQIVLHALKKSKGEPVQLTRSQIHDTLSWSSSESRLTKEITKFKDLVSETIFRYVKKAGPRVIEDSNIPFISKSTYEPEKSLLTIKLNPEFKKIFIDLTHDTTFYDLESILLLKGKYAKLLYPLLSEFKAKGVFSIRDKELYQLLNVPKSVIKNRHVDTKVIRPAIKELQYLFANLKYTTKLYKGLDRHKTYTFSFDRTIPRKYLTKESQQAFNQAKKQQYSKAYKQQVGVIKEAKKQAVKYTQRASSQGNYNYGATKSIQKQLNNIDFLN